MKRPFAFIGFSYLLGLLVAFFLGSWAIAAALVSVLALGILLFCRRKNRSWLLMLSGFSMAILMVFLAESLWLSPLEHYTDRQYKLRGEIITLLSEKEGRSCYQVRVRELEGEPGIRPFTLKLYTTKQLIFTPYDEIRCSAVLKSFEKDRGFSYRRSALGDGYHMAGNMDYQSPCTIVPRAEKPPAYFFLQVKNSLARTLDSLFAEDRADLLSAMLLGKGDRIGDELYMDFKLAGVNHILVISGMHLAVIAGFLLLLLQSLRLPRKLVLLFSALTILFYMFLTGMGSSMVRSGIMFLLLLASNFVGEEADSMNSLGFAVWLICLQNPFAGADVGFLLSVSATAGIILLSSRLNAWLLRPVPERIRRWFHPVTAALSVSVSAFLFIAPVLLYFYGSVNPVSVLAGTILSLPSSALLVLGLVSVGLGAVFLPLAAPAVILTSLACDVTLWLTKELGSLGANLPVLPERYSTLLFVSLLLLTALCVVKKPGKGALAAYGIMVLFLFGVAGFAAGISSAQIQLITQDTGEGVFAFLQKGDEAVVLSADGYNVSNALYRLKRQGVHKIAALNADLSEDLPAVDDICRQFPVNTLFCNGAAYDLSADHVMVYQREQEYTPFSGVTVKLELGGKIIQAEVEGRKIVIERELISSRALSGDVGFTSFPETKLNSSFTLLRTDDIMEVKAQGNYILTKDEAFCVSFREDIEIRRLN